MKKIFCIIRTPYYICHGNNALIPKFKKMEKSIFYHAGCPVCVSAEHDIIHLIGEKNVDVIAAAESAGVKSVPALVTPTGNVLHINFGASIADVKG
jgi:glutaredoxin 3